MNKTLSPFDAVSLLIDTAKKFGADAAESFGVSATSASADCRLQKTESLEYTHTAAVDLRVFSGKRQAVVASSVLDEKSLTDLAKRAVEMAKAVPEDPFCGLADAAQQTTRFPDLDLYDSTDVSTETLLETALKAEDAALSVKGVTNSDGAGASFEKSDVLIASTTGFTRRYQRSSCAFSVSVIAGTDAKETDYDYSSAVYYADLESPETIGRQAGERAVKRLGAQKIESGAMDVVFEPRLARGFIGVLASAINGSAIARGTSFLKDSLNDIVLNPALSLIENPFVKRGAASRACDSEGLPCVKRAIVDNGRLTTWLLDLRSARQLGLPPTGHGARGLGGTAHPAPSNLFLTGGTVAPEDLFADIKRGLYITQLFGQGINMITGDYSRGAAGFLIKNGKITTPVSEITVAGNLKKMLKTMQAANDVGDRHAVNAPTVRLNALSIAGK